MVYFLDIKSKYKKKQKSVKIRFLDTNKFGHVDKVPAIVKVPSNIKEKSFIVIESEKGEELVKVLGNIKYDKNNPSNYKFIRTATKKDRQTFKEHEKEAIKSLHLCKYLADKLNLKMNLLKAYIPLNRSKIIFYYVSESRVDFRELVKELAKRLKMRIEMRQVGVRDGVQILGAVGVCGNICCCHNFIEEFEPVNVEMIAEQNLPPLTAKYTGICGRLMCCLAYEKDNYLLKKELPPINSFIEMENKFYTIKNYDFIKEIATLLSEEGTQVSIPLNEFKEKEIKILRLPENLNPDCVGNCETCDCPAKLDMFNYQPIHQDEEKLEQEEKLKEQTSEISITLFEETKEEEKEKEEEKAIKTEDTLETTTLEITEEKKEEEQLEKKIVNIEKTTTEKQQTKKKEAEKNIVNIEKTTAEKQQKEKKKKTSIVEEVLSKLASEEKKEKKEKKELKEEEVKSKFVETLLNIVKEKEDKNHQKHHKKNNHKKKHKKNKKPINFKPKRSRKNNKHGNNGNNKNGESI